MTSHPDAEALAFFAEGLLEPDEEHTVAVHLESCDRCATTLDDLTEVTKVLAAAPAPALSQEFADLLDQRIAEAVRERETTDSSASSDPVPEETPDDGATVTPIAPRRRRFTLPRLMVVAAAAVFVVGGGTAVINGVLSSQTYMGEEASAPLTEDEEESDPDAALAYTPDVVRSGTVYTDPELAEQAGETWDRSPLDGEAEGEDATVLNQEGAPPPGADKCASALAEEVDLRVVLVDDALYGADAERAWVMFAQEGDLVEVFVMAPECGPDDVTDSVLAQQTLDSS